MTTVYTHLSIPTLHMSMEEEKYSNVEFNLDIKQFVQPVKYVYDTISTVCLVG